MSTVIYSALRPNSAGIYEIQQDVINGVYSVRISDKYIIVEYFDGDSHHTRNIPIMVVESFEVK